MTLWLLAVMPTRLPAASREQIIRAPLYVLPEPGGPWIGSTVRSSARASRRAASRSVSVAPRERFTRSHADTGRSVEQELADRQVRAVTVDPVLSDPLAQPDQRVLLSCGPDPVERDDGLGVGQWVVGRPAQVDGLRRVIEPDHLARSPS